MQKYLLAREVAERISIELGVSLSDVCDVLVKIPVADVVPRGEVVDELSNIKRQMHDKATYPHNSGIAPYISLKVVDAIIQNHIKKYAEGKNESV